MLWKIFLIPSLYIFGKKILLNKYKKFFLQKFFIFNMITDSYLVEKRELLEVSRKVNLLNLVCQDSIFFGIFQVA